jgi:protein-tyrosine phosphatase
MGNICRSPMAERLLHLALRQHVGDRVDEEYLSHGAGTGGWHVGEGMNPPAARQLRERGGDSTGFQARKLNGALVDASDLVLCATGEQVSAVLALRADAVAKTFVLGEFGRLLRVLSRDGGLDALPGGGYQRGLALVAAADAARSTSDGRVPAQRRDDLDDPWGMPDHEFARVADQIQQTVIPLAAALAGSRR